MHTMWYTYFNIVFAVRKLSQWCQDSAAHHWVTVDQVIYYLKETADLKIVYKKRDIVSYLDSVYTNNHTNWCLINEAAFLSEGDMFIWYSCKQRITTIFITETKYMSLFNFKKITVWI